MTKYERLINLSVQIVKEDAKRGHMKWKVTDVSRVTGLARSRIYELFGNNKKTILLNALSFILDDLYGRTPERKELHRTEGKLAGIIKSREIVMAHPELVTFSYKHRNRSDEIGQLLRKAEQDYLDLVSEQTGVKDPRTLLFMRTLIHGVSQAPFLNDNQVQEMLEELGVYAALKAKNR